MTANYIHDFEEWASEFTFSTEMVVRFAEIDVFGILNNATVFSYFEYARVEFMKHVGLMTEWLDASSKLVPVIADAQCDYVKPCYYDDKITINVKANTVGNSSVDIHYLGKNQKGEIVFTGRGTMVQISTASGKGVSWSDEEKRLLKQN